jgi:monovalent cation/hydrogen antiporter
MESLAWFATAVFLAVAVAAFSRSRGWGFALPVLLAGAFVDVLPIGIDAPIDPEIALVAILAPLVFGEALGSSYLDLRKVSKPILTLAVGLVVVTTAAIGGVVVAIAAIPLAMAFALGAILAPTDAVAVSAVARRASLPRRLVSILEGESLVNDGTGLTALRVAVIASIAGSISLMEIGAIFAFSVLGGIVVGAIGGWALSSLSRRFTDVTAMNAFVLIAPFILYVLAEEVEGSGILAVVIAGLWYAQSQISNPGHRGRMQGTTVWRQFTFILQAVAFFVVGMEFSATLRALAPSSYLTVGLLVAACVLTLIVMRFLFVYAMLGVSRLRGTTVSQGQLRGAAIISWAGARGPVSGMAAFSLPLVMMDGAPLPQRDLVLATTFGVIVATLLLSYTLAPFARLLKIPPDDDAATLQRVRGALAAAAMGALTNIEEEAIASGQPWPRETIDALRADLQRRLDFFSAEESQAAREGQSFASSVAVKLRLIQAEKEALIGLRDDEGLPDAIVRPLMGQLDLREQALR